jgi:uncharacterized protein YuzE
MKVTYDAAIDAAYIYFVDSIAAGAVAMTYSCDPSRVKGMINLDFDSEGRLLGMEVLDASHYLSESLLQAAGQRNT